MSQAAGIRAGRAFVELSTNDSRLVKGLQAAQRRLQTFGAGLTKIGGGLIGAGAGLAAPLLASVSKFAASGDELFEMSERTGMTVKALSEMRHVASRAGTDFAGFGKAIAKQQQSLVKGSKAYADLGLSVEELMKLSPDKQFEAIADSVMQIEDPAQRTAAAMAVWGKGGIDLLPMIQGGAAGIRELREEANKFGLNMSTEDAAVAAELTDRFADLKTVMMSMVIQAGSALAPAITTVVSRMLSAAATANQWIRNNRQLVVWIAWLAVGLIAAGTVLVGFGGFMFAAAAAISAVISVGGTAAAIFAAIVSPVGLLIAGVVGLAAAFFYFTEVGQDTISWFWTEFQKLTQIVTDTVGGMYDALSAGNLGLAAEIAFTGIKLAMATIMDSVLKLFGSNIDSMMKMLAGVVKKVGEVIAKINAGRQEAVNWLSEMIGSVFLDEQGQQMLREDNARASAGAQSAADEWTNWDSDKAGEEWANQLDPEKIKQELLDLNKQAAKEKSDLETKELKLREAEKRKFEGPDMAGLQIQSGMQEKGSTFSTFSGALVGQNFGLGGLQEKQLQTQQQILTAAEETARNTAKKSGNLTATS